MCLSLFLVAGCSTTRSVRLELGSGESIHHLPVEEDDEEETGPVELDEDTFQEAMTRLARDVRPFAHPLREARLRFGVPERGGVYLYEGRRLHAVREDETSPQLLESYADEALTRGYGRWCEREHRAGDCLRLLEEGPLLGSDGRYALALAIAMEGVWEETAESLRGMADPQALRATLTASVAMYLMLWSLPEPVSKGLAALLTATAVAYLGVDTVWRVLEAWVVLVRRVDEARTFEELEAAGEAYGEVLGDSAARVFVMLATAAVGRTAGLATKGPGLPGSARAAVFVEAQAGFAYPALRSVESVALTAEGFTLGLAPGALAMTVHGSRTHKHHVATNKNSVSAERSGPWTPRFQSLFKRAGMELKDPENIVPVRGHHGPHPEAYHRIVYRELETATRGCGSVEQCRSALTAMLRKLSREVATPGTELNLLVTRKALR
ncbi:hypothetical protein MFUL124B02_42970 [Myxococcus fulvus 124B02]|nr:hypothetical protein MFUL124B02_42970 [Myxococcus fulvus 124B02]